LGDAVEECAESLELEVEGEIARWLQRLWILGGRRICSEEKNCSLERE
jgi:hypothetical protein